jgi:hypothetical protein
MSDLDKTGSKLIDSIRKTKSGPETAAVESAKKKTTAVKAASPKPAATSKPAKPKKPAKKRSSATRKAAPKAKISAISQVPYQDGSQVWPD